MADWKTVDVKDIRLGNTVELRGVIQEVTSLRATDDGVNINGNHYKKSEKVEVFK